MASSSAVFEDEFVVPKSALSEDITLASFDKGCSLIKALIGYRENDTIRFKCLTFKSSDFDDAMEWMRSQILLGKDSVVRITGAGGDALREDIANALNCQTKWVHEIASQCKGIDFLLKHASDTDMYYPEPNPQFTFNMDLMGDALEEMQKQVLIQLGNQNESDTQPTIFAFMGSGMGVCLIPKEGTGKMVSVGLVAGRSLLAFSNLLLGTSNFQELNELAMKGDRTKVDILAKEMFAETKSLGYRLFPEEMSIFPMAKLADDNAKAKATREDLAAGLLTTFAEILSPVIFAEAKNYKASQIILGGNLGRSQFFREAFASGEMMHGGLMMGIKVKFLKTGHTGAIGAMIFDS